jgi:hypothetical protein
MHFILRRSIWPPSGLFSPDFPPWRVSRLLPTLFDIGFDIGFDIDTYHDGQSGRIRTQTIRSRDSVSALPSRPLSWNESVDRLMRLLHLTY